jgi:hypothetical protein
MFILLNLKENKKKARKFSHSSRDVIDHDTAAAKKKVSWRLETTIGPFHLFTTV